MGPRFVLAPYFFDREVERLVDFFAPVERLRPVDEPRFVVDLLDDDRLRVVFFAPPADRLRVDFFVVPVERLRVVERLAVPVVFFFAPPDRLPPLRPPLLDETVVFFFPRPLPLFLPPPSSLLTVA